MARPATRGRRAPWAELALALASILAVLLAAEAAARVWVFWRWPPGKVTSLTQPTAVRGRFTRHPELGYALTPRFRWGTHSHNRLGYRGPDFAPEKPPGGLRVVIAGASTAYGDRVADADTSSRQLEAMLRAAFPERPVEVVNAGTPGWTSAETLANLRLRLLDLDPDAVVILDGRNEIFPQLFRGYRDDYSHYRVPGFDLAESNAGWKRVFRISHLAMILVSAGDGHLGFSHREENPLYASIRYENLPTREEIDRNAADPRRIEGFRRNLSEEIRLLRAQGAIPVLSTIPFRSEAYASGVIWRDPAILPDIGRAVARNNALVRELAREKEVPLVDAAAALSDGEHLVDDCHFNEKGERAFARMVYGRLEPLLRARVEARERAATVPRPVSRSAARAGSGTASVTTASRPEEPDPPP